MCYNRTMHDIQKFVVLFGVKSESQRFMPGQPLSCFISRSVQTWLTSLLDAALRMQIQWLSRVLTSTPGCFALSQFQACSREQGRICYEKSIFATCDSLQHWFTHLICLSQAHLSCTCACAGTPSSPIAEPDQHVQVSVKGPKPGYIATPIIMVQTALTLQQERERCQAAMGQGGVYTTGALFGETTLIQRLSKAGVLFEVTKRTNGHGREA